MSFNSASVRRSSGSHLSSFPQYQSLAETYGCSVVHKNYMSDHFARCSGLYHHDLLGHFGCVNAIEFSSKGGEFVVSGVDFLLFVFIFYSVFCPLIRGTPKFVHNCPLVGGIVHQVMFTPQFRCILVQRYF